MKTTKLSHILFSLAVVAALVLAAIPMAPAHAMSASADAQAASISAPEDSASALIGAGAVVCKWKTVWRNGHWVRIRVCHRVPR